MLINIFSRARELIQNNEKLFAPPSLSFFLENEVNINDFENNGIALKYFVNLDDNDIWTAIKVWKDHVDPVLSELCNGMVNRKLFKIIVSDSPIDKALVKSKLDIYKNKFKISDNEANYFISLDVMETNMYNEEDDSIDIIYNNNKIKDISEASDMLNIELLSKKVKKYYFAFLRD
jgi:hypothetical protein